MLKTELASTSSELTAEQSTTCDLREQLRQRENYWKEEWDTTERVHSEHLEKVHAEHKHALERMRCVTWIMIEFLIFSRLQFDDELCVKESENSKTADKLLSAECSITSLIAKIEELRLMTETSTAREQTNEIDRVSNLETIRSLRTQLVELEKQNSSANETHLSEVAKLMLRVTSATEELSTTSKRYNDLHAEHQQLKLKYDTDVKSLQQDVKDKLASITNLKFTLQQREEQYTREVTKLTSRMEVVDRECDGIVRKLHNEKLEMESQYEGRIFDVEASLTELRTQLEQQTSQYAKMTRKLHYEQLEHEEKITRIEQEKTSLKMRCEKLAAENESHEERMQDIRNTVESMESEAQNRDANIAQLRSTIADLHITVETRDAHIQQLSHDLAASVKDSNALKLRCSTLQDEVYTLEEQQGTVDLEMKSSLHDLHLRFEEVSQHLVKSQEHVMSLGKANDVLKMEIMSNNELVSAMRHAQQENARIVTEHETTIQNLTTQLHTLRSSSTSTEEKHAVALESLEQHYTDKMKSVEGNINALKRRIGELTSLLEQRDTHCIQLNETTKQLTSDLQEAHRKYEVLQDRVSSATETSKLHETERYTFETTISKYTEEVNVQSQRISYLAAENSAAVSRAEKAEASLAEIQSLLDTNTSILRIRDASIQDMTAELTRLREDNGELSVKLQRENDTLLRSNQSLQQRCDTMQTQLQSAEAETVTLKEQGQELLELIQQQQQAIDDASAREGEWAQIRSNLLSTASERSEKYKKRITEIEAAHRDAIQQLRCVNDELMTAYETIREKNACLSEYQRRLQDLAEEARRTTSTVSECGGEAEYLYDEISSMSKTTDSIVLCTKCKTPCSDVRDSMESSMSLVSDIIYDCS